MLKREMLSKWKAITSQRLFSNVVEEEKRLLENPLNSVIFERIFLQE
jgi:hypothetical protein